MPTETEYEIINVTQNCSAPVRAFHADAVEGDKLPDADVFFDLFIGTRSFYMYDGDLIQLRKCGVRKPVASGVIRYKAVGGWHWQD